MLKKIKNIIKNEDVFESNYKPHQILFRKEVIEELTNNTYNLLYTYGWGDNVFVYGEKGTGKTLTVKYLSKELEKENEDIKKRLGAGVKIVYINCNGVRTKYQIVKEILKKLKNQDNLKRGLPTCDYLDLLKKHLREHPVNLLIILDEAHAISKNDRDSLFYSLSRLKEQDEIGDAKITIITITNEIFFQNTLSAPTLSSYRGYSLVFSPYNAKQLEEILLQRAEEGLIKGSYDSNAIKKIAYEVAEKYKGDARRAILILKKSAQFVENKLSKEEVGKAIMSIERNEMNKYVLNMNDTKLILLKIVNGLMKGGRTPFFDVIYSYYQSVMAYRNEEAQSERNIYRILDKIEETELIIKKYSSKKKKYFYFIEQGGEFLEKMINMEMERRGIYIMDYEENSLSNWNEVD